MAFRSLCIEWQCYNQTESRSCVRLRVRDVYACISPCLMRNDIVYWKILSCLNVIINNNLVSLIVGVFSATAQTWRRDKIRNRLTQSRACTFYLLSLFPDRLQDGWQAATIKALKKSDTWLKWIGGKCVRKLRICLHWKIMQVPTAHGIINLVMLMM